MVTCLTCSESFSSFEAYQRHCWQAHGGRRDRGEAWSERTSLESLPAEAECPEPPTLDR